MLQEVSNVICQPCGELKIQGFSSTNKKMLDDKAEQQGVSTSYLVKQIIPQILSQYPDSIKNNFCYKGQSATEINRYIRVRYGTNHVHRQCVNIASHMGVTLSEFMKVKITDSLLGIKDNLNYIPE